MGTAIGGILSFLISFAVMASIYAIFTMGLNVHWGHTGLINFGVAGFFCVGAYTTALVTSPMPTGVLAQYVKQAFGFNAPFLVGVIAAGIVCALLAVLIGMLTLRLSEGYLAISTIGIAETIRMFFNNERWLANGPQGLIGLPQPLHNLVPPAYYNYVYLVIVLIFMMTIYIALEKGIRSPWGRVLRAIREDEIMSGADGKNVFFFKLQSLALGAFIMGVGGALYAHFSAAIQPSAFEPLFGTFVIWAMVTLGGTGNNKGAIAGAFVVWALWSWSTFMILKLVPPVFQTRAPYIRYLLIGFLLIFIVIKKPKGLISEERQVSKF